MAHYLVRAKLKAGVSNELRRRIANQEFLNMRPFGKSLTQAMDGIRHDPKTGEVLWEEEDYCSPPLAMERAAVLDKYFDDIKVDNLPEGEGWKRISDLPTLWDDPPPE
jgi:hypothetical protein